MEKVWVNRKTGERVPEGTPGALLDLEATERLEQLKAILSRDESATAATPTETADIHDERGELNFLRKIGAISEEEAEAAMQFMEEELPQVSPETADTPHEREER